MTPEEIQNKVDNLEGRLDDLSSGFTRFARHDHYFEGENLYLKNHLNFGYHSVSVTIPSGDATITTRYGRFFTADYDLEIVGAEETHQVVATGADTLDVYKLTTGQATSSGVSVLSSTFTVNSTANTPVRKTATTTRANRILKRGDGLALINASGTFAGLDTLTLTIYYLPFGIMPKY